MGDVSSTLTRSTKKYKYFKSIKDIMDYKEYLKESKMITLKTRSNQDPIIHFDMKNNKIISEFGAQKRSWKVKDKYGMAIQVQKTQVQAQDGIEGLYKKMKKSIEEDFMTSAYFPKFKMAMDKGWGKQI